MSRYLATTKTGQDMAFGFDRPLQEYFMQVFDKDDELLVDANSSGNSMVSSQCRPLSNSSIHQLLVDTMCDKDQAKYQGEFQALLLDLPF